MALAAEHAWMRCCLAQAVIAATCSTYQQLPLGALMVIPALRAEYLVAPFALGGTEVAHFTCTLTTIDL